VNPTKGKGPLRAAVLFIIIIIIIITMQGPYTKERKSRTVYSDWSKALRLK
jgi:hypothetical protein